MTASDGKFALNASDGPAAAGAIEALATALEGIDPAMLDAAGRDHLERARVAAGWLAAQLASVSARSPGPEAAQTAPVLPPPLDEARFRRLLDVAGAEGAAELLARLIEDLRAVEGGLRRALATLDAAEVRAQSHVLIALAGAVGARSLQRLAEGLNAAAHRGAAAETRRIGETTLEQLGRLIAFIAEQEAEGSPP